MMKANGRLGRLTRISLAAAFMCVLAPLSFPIGIIPFTLASFCLYLIALCFRPIDAFLTLLLYIAVGMLGLPVFSGFTGGAQVFVGPTGGFLLAYPLAALLISVLSGGEKSNRVSRLLALFLGTVLLYVCGVIGYVFIGGVPFDFSVCLLFLPLLLIDFLKMAASLILFSRLYPFLKKKG